jgi:hypothetical protein
VVAILRLRAASHLCHVADAAYAPLKAVYVRQGTKARQSTKEAPNFVERRLGEVRRIPIPRTPVNKGERMR